MTKLSDDIDLARLLARQAADSIPPAPTPLMRTRFPDLAQDWRLLVIEAGYALARSLGCELDLMKRALGPAIEVGFNPPWRMLLTLAVVATADALGQTVDPVMTADVSWWLSSGDRAPARRRALAAV